MSDPNGARNEGDAEDEILILGGKTRLVEHDHPSKPSTPTVSSPSSTTKASSSISQSNISVPVSFSPVSMSSQPTDALNLLSSLPPAPRIEDIPMNTAMATAFEHTNLPSAWSDQEALLIKYLSSGVDLNVAQTSAYANDADPAAFMWADMSYSNSPDSQPSMENNNINNYSQDGDLLSKAAAPLNAQAMQTTNLESSGFPLYMNGTNFSSVMQHPQQRQQSQQQQQQQQQQHQQFPLNLENLAAWDPSQWSDPQVFY